MESLDHYLVLGAIVMLGVLVFEGCGTETCLYSESFNVCEVEGIDLLLLSRHMERAFFDLGL